MIHSQIDRAFYASENAMIVLFGHLRFYMTQAQMRFDHGKVVDLVGESRRNLTPIFSDFRALVLDERRLQVRDNPHLAGSKEVPRALILSVASRFDELLSFHQARGIDGML